MAVNRSHVLVASLAGAAIAAVAMAGAGDHSSWNGSPFGSLINASTAPVIASAPGAQMSFADIFEKVSPAVVSIHVTSKVDTAAMRRAIPGFENFPFDIVPRGGGQGDEGAGGGALDPRRAPKQMSSGSGFFISSDGYIVTNNHVVDNAEEIKVTLNDGKELKATVVGRDEGTDLAVISVEGHDFPYVNFENKARPRVGDWVLAVGNPYDLGGTATAGIVSAYNRDIGEKFVDYIQIDAPDQPRQLRRPDLRHLWPRDRRQHRHLLPLRRLGRHRLRHPGRRRRERHQAVDGRHQITRGYIGATIQDLNDEMASSFGLGGRKGAIVAGLVAGRPGGQRRRRAGRRGRRGQRPAGDSRPRS